MSPSNVGNFGIGLVELVLGLLFLAGGWVISADDGVSAAASRSWAWRCMVLSLSISSSNSITAASLSSSGMPSSADSSASYALVRLLGLAMFPVELFVGDVRLLIVSQVVSIGRWFDSGSEDQKMLKNL
ncbi:hypothetical protein T08_9915 [Trichinella sp. T8]|nr:hypothetical protein T08_9915 [Trichinella sp. T8]